MILWTSDHAARAVHAMLWVLCLSLWMSCGCGASQLKTQAQANLVVGDVLTEAQATISEHIDGDIAGCLRMDAEPAAKSQCIDGVQARWQPIDEAHRVAVDAHRAWSEALIAVVQAGEAEMEPASALSLLASVVRAYRAIVEAAADIGLQLPALPEVAP